MLIPGYEVYQELPRNAWFRLSRGRCQEGGISVLLKTPCAEPKPKPLALGQLLSLPLTGMLRLYSTGIYD
jgi:hypothetical protein